MQSVTLRHYPCIYSKHFCNRSQPFLGFIRDLLKYRSKGDVFLAGDFNARIRCTQFTQFCSSLNFSPLEEIDNSQGSRLFSDPSTKSLIEHFLIFGATCNLKVLNGIFCFPNSHFNTCFSYSDANMVDFLLSFSSHSSSLISTFKVRNPQPESDHATFFFILSISKTITPSINKHVLSFPSFCLIPCKKNLYATHLRDLLKHINWSQYPHGANLRFIELLKNVVSKFFLQNSNKKTRRLTCNEWFDFDCKLARAEAIDRSLDL